MTVKELRLALEGVPEEVDVFVEYAGHAVDWYPVVTWSYWPKAEGIAGAEIGRFVLGEERRAAREAKG